MTTLIFLGGGLGAHFGGTEGEITRPQIPLKREKIYFYL